jgi:hypothetical protein
MFSRVICIQSSDQKNFLTVYFFFQHLSLENLKINFFEPLRKKCFIELSIEKGFPIVDRQTTFV